MLTKDMVTKPLEADEDDLLVVHSKKYLNALKVWKNDFIVFIFF